MRQYTSLFGTSAIVVCSVKNWVEPRLLDIMSPWTCHVLLPGTGHNVPTCARRELWRQDEGLCSFRCVGASWRWWLGCCGYCTVNALLRGTGLGAAVSGPLLNSVQSSQTSFAFNRRHSSGHCGGKGAVAKAVSVALAFSSVNVVINHLFAHDNVHSGWGEYFIQAVLFVWWQSKYSQLFQLTSGILWGLVLGTRRTATFRDANYPVFQTISNSGSFQLTIQFVLGLCRHWSISLLAL